MCCASICYDLRSFFFTNNCCVYCKRTKTQRTWWHAKLRHSLCGCNKKNSNKKPTTIEYMKTGFLPTKVGWIACCDHKMSSASSLSPYQAVCCTEHSPLALGAGRTSMHPSPIASLLSPLSVSLLPGCSDPPFPSTPTPPLPSLSPCGA